MNGRTSLFMKAKLEGAQDKTKGSISENDDKNKQGNNWQLAIGNPSCEHEHYSVFGTNSNR